MPKKNVRHRHCDKAYYMTVLKWIQVTDKLRRNRQTVKTVLEWCEENKAIHCVFEVSKRMKLRICKDISNKVDLQSPRHKNNLDTFNFEAIQGGTDTEA